MLSPISLRTCFTGESCRRRVLGPLSHLGSRRRQSCCAQALNLASKEQCLRIHHDERGQTIILVALSIPLLLGFIGIATDVGLLFKDKRTLQTAADAAAIAGALHYKYTDWQTVAKNASKDNGYQDGSNGVSVKVNDQPTWAASNYYNVKGFIEATVSKPESTIFLSIFGFRAVTVSARAVAANLASGSGCIYTTGATGTTFTVNGNVTVTAPSCGLVVESNDPSAMLVHGTSASVTFASIGIVGGLSTSGSPSITPPNPVQHMAPESDPLNFLPQFSFSSSTTTTGKGKTKVTTETYTVSCESGYDCSSSPIGVPTTCATTGTSTNGTYTVAAGATLSPGCYTTLSFPNSGAAVTLSPGLYIVDGDIDFGNANVSGTGVTFYYTGNVNFGNGVYNFSAPNDVTQLYNGVLFSESTSDTNSITFGGNSTSVFKGAIYAPNTDFNMHGTPSVTVYADLVVKSITLSGNPDLTSYGSLSGVSSPFTTAALVE